MEIEFAFDLIFHLKKMKKKTAEHFAYKSIKKEIIQLTLTYR